MRELEELALRHITHLARQAEDMLTHTALKSHNEKERVNAEKDIYPVSGVLRDIARWSDAILKNNKS